MAKATIQITMAALLDPRTLRVELSLQNLGTDDCRCAAHQKHRATDGNRIAYIQAGHVGDVFELTEPAGNVWNSGFLHRRHPCFHQSHVTNSAVLIACAEVLVLSALMGQTQATAILRTGFIVLLMLNVIPLGLLFANLQSTHSRLYTREQEWRVGVLIFVAGTLIPLGLTLLNGGLLFIFGSVIFLLLESWVVRFVYVKIPHTSPLEIRSRIV